MYLLIQFIYLFFWFSLLFIYLFIYLLTSLLEYNCFTMVCQFLLYNKVNQLYVYIYILFHILILLLLLLCYGYLKQTCLDINHIRKSIVSILFLINFYWNRVDLQYCQFLLSSKVNQLYIYIYLLFFGLFSHIGHYREY